MDDLTTRQVWDLYYEDLTPKQRSKYWGKMYPGGRRPFFRSTNQEGRDRTKKVPIIVGGCK